MYIGAKKTGPNAPLYSVQSTTVNHDYRYWLNNFLSVVGSVVDLIKISVVPVFCASEFIEIFEINENTTDSFEGFYVSREIYLYYTYFWYF